MEEVNDNKSGYEIKNIILIESSFKRKPSVDFNNTKRKFELGRKVKENGNRVEVALTVRVSHKSEDEQDYSISVTMLGIFEQVGNAEIESHKKFGYINGAAILFPFVREHISNVALKGGLGPIILPPVNFLAFPCEDSK
jgi:preprotein translocase subunit SecB